MRFMLTATWKQPPNEEIMALIPAEQARGKELEEQGIRESFNMAADQLGIFIIISAPSRAME